MAVAKIAKLKKDINAQNLAVLISKLSRLSNILNLKMASTN